MLDTGHSLIGVGPGQILVGHQVDAGLAGRGVIAARAVAAVARGADCDAGVGEGGRASMRSATEALFAARPDIHHDTVLV